MKKNGVGVTHTRKFLTSKDLKRGMLGVTSIHAQCEIHVHSDYGAPSGVRIRGVLHQATKRNKHIKQRNPVCRPEESIVYFRITNTKNNHCEYKAFYPTPH